MLFLRQLSRRFFTSDLPQFLPKFRLKTIRKVMINYDNWANFASFLFDM